MDPAEEKKKRLAKINGSNFISFRTSKYTEARGIVRGLESQMLLADSSSAEALKVEIADGDADEAFKAYRS
eukprot:14183193-Alexandrium_andersonii.AAC.1